MMLVRAVPHGPWGEDMGHRQACEAVDEHVDTCVPADCPIFQKRLAGMLRDTDMSDLAGTEDMS